MTREELNSVVKILMRVYGDKFKMEQSVFNVWYECLADLRFDVMQKATSDFIKTSKFPPTIADLREKYSQLWNEYTSMIRHISESFELASGCYPDVTDEQRAVGKKTFIEIVNRYPRERKEKVANSLSQKIIGYVREIENGTDTGIMPFDRYMEQMKNEFDG